MITVIPATKFKTIPWKNGLGHTTELAINDGGNLDDFDWRLSIASVVNDGEFSNFSGYQRNLILIDGLGLTLDHQNGTVDKLTKTLDIARFDGSCQTLGILSSGAIKDFNIITNKKVISPKVRCYVEQQQIEIQLKHDNLYFAYSLTDDIAVQYSEQEQTILPVGHLVKLSAINIELEDDQLTLRLIGKNMIIVQLEPI